MEARFPLDTRRLHMTSAALALRNRTSGRVARLGLSAAFIVLGMSVAILLLVPRFSRPVALADVGTVAPDFLLRDTSGHNIGLSEQRGKCVVLFFDSSHSLHQAGDARQRIAELAKQYAADARVKFLGLDEPAAAAATRQPVDAVAIAAAQILPPDEPLFPTLLDDRGSVALRYSADQFPMVVVIDPRGLVRYRGPIDDNADAAFVTRTFAADALHDVLEDRPGAAVAVRH